MQKMKAWIRLLRIKHYIKNLLIYVPIILNGNLFDKKYFTKCLIGFISFSLLTSFIYIVNDISDLERDRQIKTKCNRPLVTGIIKKDEALAVGGGILIVSILLTSILVYKTNANVCSIIILMIYLLLNLGYSFGLKNVPIVDTIILAIGFLIRVYYGGAIANLQVTNWIYLTILSGAFYLGFGKRRNELIISGKNGRETSKKYTVNFLDKNMYMCQGLALVFYSLSCIDTETVISKRGINLIWTIPIVLLIFFKYNLDIEVKEDGDPVNVFLKDKILLGISFFYILSIIMTIYLF